MNKISQIFSTLFFIGYSKWAPGTIGSLASLIIIMFLQSFISNTIFIALFICIFILATIFITIYSKTINNHDAREIVIDEFLGIYLILIFICFIYFFIIGVSQMKLISRFAILNFLLLSC